MRIRKDIISAVLNNGDTGFYNRFFFSGFVFCICLMICAGCGRSTPAPAPEAASEDMTKGSSEGVTQEPEQTAVEEVKLTPETAKVGICFSRSSNEDNERLLPELIHTLELRGFLQGNIYVQKLTGSRTRQAKEVGECLDQGCSVLVISAVSDDRIPAMADMVSQGGSSAVFVNCDPGPEELSRWKQEQMPCVWIGSDYAQKLACQMSILYDWSGTDRGLDFNEDGHIGAVLVGGGEQAQAALEETVSDLGTNLEILGTIESKDFQEISDYLQELINENKKELELVLCSSEMTAQAAADGVQLRHRLVGRDILVIGTDAHEDTCTAIINKLMSGSTFTDFYEQANLAAVAVKDFIEGNQKEKIIPGVLFRVTETNAQEVLDQLWTAKEKSKKLLEELNRQEKAAGDTEEADGAAGGETAEEAAGAAGGETAEEAAGAAGGETAEEAARSTSGISTETASESSSSDRTDG